MRSSTSLLFLVGTSLAASSQPVKPNVQRTYNLIQRSVFERQSTSCNTGYQACGTGCILNSSTCCSQPDGLSCPSGYYCDGSGADSTCCETGQTCTGVATGCTKYSKLCGSDCIPEDDTCDEDTSSTASSLSGTTTVTRTSTATYSSSSATGSSSCSSDEKWCNGGCIPLDGVCCTGPGAGWCDAGYTCTSDLKCQLDNSASSLTNTATGTATGSATYTSASSFATGSASCNSTQVFCNGGCIPTDGVCCTGPGAGWCDAGYYCTSDLKCQPEDDGSSSSTGFYSSSSSRTQTSLATNAAFGSGSSTSAVIFSTLSNPAPLTTASPSSSANAAGAGSSSSSTSGNNGAVLQPGDLTIGLTLLITGLLGLIGL